MNLYILFEKNVKDSFPTITNPEVINALKTLKEIKTRLNSNYYNNNIVV